MNEMEARVRCLELAATLNARAGNHSAQAVVETATVLYHFAQASPEGENPPDIADKPKRGRKPKVDDLLS